MTRPICTFSIVARDPLTGDLGVGVASKFLAVGAVVPFARAGAGAVATQSYANPAYGPQGLALLEVGAGPDGVLEAFRRTDQGLEQRQFGVVSARGEAVTFTGEACHPWAGGLTADGVAVQGNLLAGPEVVEAMLSAYQASHDQPFARRLLAAVVAGDAAGGDRRGRQSAALLCVGTSEDGLGKGYGGLTDRYLDLRVDDHAEPLKELERLLGVHDLLFGRPEHPRAVTDAELGWLRALLVREGYAEALPEGAWEARTEQALWDLFGTENLEERWVAGGQVDPVALAYLSEKFGGRIE